MTHSSASGERQALRGYRWQYDQLASIVYDALLNDTFVSVRLTDPDVGRVDDLVLITKDGVIGHQFKCEEPPGSITFNDFLKERRSRSNRPMPSWLWSLAEGWLALGGERANASVCFITNLSRAQRGKLARRKGVNFRPPLTARTERAVYRQLLRRPLEAAAGLRALPVSRGFLSGYTTDHSPSPDPLSCSRR
jgi:hypothetical protein